MPSSSNAASNASLQVRVFPDSGAMSGAAAEQFVARMNDALVTRNRFTVALAGGSTPRPLYEHLAGPLRDAIPWEQVHLFWGDERYVPHDDPSSNVQMVREALLADAPMSPGNVHPMPTDRDDPEDAAADYADTLHAVFPDDATFDLVLLGLGGDGHTASLFPDDPTATAMDGVPWVRAVTAPPRYAVRTRLSLTLPALNRARDVFFLVSGATKHDAVDAVLEAQDPALPPTHVRPQRRTTWFLDAAARSGGSR